MCNKNPVSVCVCTGAAAAAASKPELNEQTNIYPNVMVLYIMLLRHYVLVGVWEAVNAGKKDYKPYNKHKVDWNVLSCGFTLSFIYLYSPVPVNSGGQYLLSIDFISFLVSRDGRKSSVKVLTIRETESKTSAHETFAPKYRYHRNDVQTALDES